MPNAGNTAGGAAPLHPEVQQPPQAVGQGQRPKPKRHLRNYILDKELQLSYVVFVAVLSAMIAGTLGYLLYTQENYASSKIIKSLDDAEFLRDNDEAKAEIKKELTKQDSNEVAVMLVVGLGLMTVLTGYLIIMTHKVAGPLFKVGMYFDRIRDGKLPQVHALRKGDHLRDFFEKFRAMDEALRDRTKAEIELYARFLKEAEAAGVPSSGELGHRLDELRSLSKTKEASLT